MKIYLSYKKILKDMDIDFEKRIYDEKDIIAREKILELKRL